MRILFAHKNFPAQFGAFGEWLAGQGWEVAFLTQRAGAASAAFRVVACPADHRTPAEGVHRYVRPLEGAVITGQAFARAAVDLDRVGLPPRHRHGPCRLGGRDLPQGRLARDLRRSLLRMVLQLALSRPHPLRRRGRRPARRPRPQPHPQRPPLGRLLDRDPRPLPDPLPGGAVPRVDARPADGDARRRRHRPPFAGRAPGGAGPGILARWGVPAGRRGR